MGKLIDAWMTFNIGRIYNGEHGEPQRFARFQREIKAAFIEELMTPEELRFWVHKMADMLVDAYLESKGEGA